MANKYTLSVTAGPDYTHQSPIPVNTEQPTPIHSTLATTHLTVRIQNYRTTTPSHPSTTPYFSSPPHQHDLYSLSFTLIPSKTIPGHNLVLGNDFDHPIRDRLPPGFNQAFKAATWFIDPGLYGDVKADKPYLYSPALSGINALRIGGKGTGAGDGGRKEDRGEGKTEVILEGADGDGVEVREKLGLPEDGPARMKWFLQEAHLKKFEFEEGRRYGMDFFNTYLDFNDFALKLPSFGVIPSITIPILSYWDGQPLRYVLKNRVTDETIFVIVFTLVPKDEEAKKDLEAKKEKPAAEVETNNDDVD